MGQPCSVYEVANRIDAWQVGLHLFVDAHTASLVVQPLLHQVFKPACVGTAADRHEHVLGWETLLTLLRAGNDLFLTSLLFESLNFSSRDDSNAPLGQNTYKQATHLFIDGGKDVGQHLQDGDFRAEA